MIDKVLKIEYKNLSKPCSECKKSILKCIKKNKFYCPNCGTIYLVNKPIKTKGKKPIKKKPPLNIKAKRSRKLKIKNINRTKKNNRDKKRREYNSYLKSKEWRDKRKDVLARDGNRCTFCFSGNDLHVHHLTYDNFKNEPLSDLVTLCSVCHKGEHLKSK